MNRKAIATAGVAVLAATLTACGGSGVVTLDAVEGNRDDLRYVKQVTKMRQVDIKSRQCRVVTDTRVVNGKSKVVASTKCKDVKVGTRQEAYQVKPPKWCVELDAVNGEATKNDQWFQVDYGTYQLAGEMTEGTRINFTPLAEGC